MRRTTHQVPTFVRDMVKMRANGLCELCGQQCNQYDLHHRQQLSVGGKDRAYNLMGLHRRCHGIVHHDVAVSERYGWMIRSTDNPAFVACRMFDGTFYLTPYGTREVSLP